MNSSRALSNVGARQLAAFLEIARQQSLARAAERIHLSPSGLSMLLKELERQLGASLFERTTRSLALTEAGRRLVPVAERIVEEFRGMDAALRGGEAAARSRLDIACTPIVAASLLPRALAAFGPAHPGVRPQVLDGDVGAVRQAVLEGRADLGLGFFLKPAAGLARQPVCRFRLMRIGPPDAATTPGPSVPWASLAGLPLVSLPADNPIQGLVDAHLPRGRDREADPAPVNFMGTVLALVRAGLGQAVVPSIVKDDCLRLGLQARALVEPAVHLDLYVATRRGAADKPAVAAFIAALRRAAGGRGTSPGGGV